MPIWDRQCKACSELFEVICKISERDSVHACPACGSVEGEWRPSAPMTSIRSERFMTHKKDNGFKEVIQKIQSRNQRSEICQR